MLVLNDNLLTFGFTPYFLARVTNADYSHLRARALAANKIIASDQRQLLSTRISTLKIGGKLLIFWWIDGMAAISESSGFLRNDQM